MFLVERLHWQHFMVELWAESENIGALGLRLDSGERFDGISVQ